MDAMNANEMSPEQRAQEEFLNASDPAGEAAEETSETATGEETPETTETAEAAETPASEETPADPEDASYSKRVQKRIGDLTRKQREEERLRITAENKLAAYEKKDKAGPRPQPPDPKTFQDDLGVIDPQKFQEAMIAHEDALHTWRLAQEAPPPAATPSEPEVPHSTTDVTVQDSFFERAEEVKARHPDFDEVLNREVFSQPMMDILFKSEVGPQVAYYLGSNEEESLKIANLPLGQMATEMVKLEEKFSAPPAKRAKSNAPAPIAPVDGNAIVEKDPEKMSTEQWMEWDRKQTLQKMGHSP